MLTRGDANVIPDEAIRIDALVGRTTAASAWQETTSQRNWRLIVETLFRASPRIAQRIVPALWQLRRLTLATFGAVSRYGVTGVLARLWAKTFGRMLDVDVVYTLRAPASPEFAPVAPFRYERHASSSPVFDEAAKVLRVDVDKRREQEVFVATDPRDETVAACSFNDRATGAVAAQRGVAVLPRYRGHGLATREWWRSSITSARRIVLRAECSQSSALAPSSGG
jgi:GNAT superfamily N-acetyltransferase